MASRREIRFSAAKEGMRAVIKNQECTLTQVKVMKGKNASQLTKVRLMGQTEAGKKVSIVKPEDRMFEIIEENSSAATLTEHPVNAVDGQGHSSSSDSDSGSESEDPTDLVFTVSSAYASMTAPVRCGDLRKGHFVVLKGDKPCKITCITIAQPGKHGHTKATVTGTDIFTGRKYIQTGIPTDHNISAPVMTRSEWQLTDLSQQDGRLTLMNDGGDLREDLDLPTDSMGESTELADKVRATFNDIIEAGTNRAVFLTILHSMGKEQVIDFTVRDSA